jgi:hypothetical protein
MLSTDDPRLVFLRRQAEVATVTGKCSCGCATVDFAVDHDRADAASGLCSPVTETRNRWPSGSDRPRELLLFLDGGWLEGLEIVYYGSPPPAEFPPPDEFETPEIRC